jgi:YggT family protein
VFVLQNLVVALAAILNSLLSLYFWILLAAVVLSWVNPDPGNPIVRFLRAVTEPVLWQVRRRLPFVYAGGIDFSPLVVLLAIQFLQIVVVRSLYELASRMAALQGPGGLPLA